MWGTLFTGYQARPVEPGMLGVLDLTTLGYALQLRWECLARTDPSRMWTALPSKEEKVVRAMFNLSTSVIVGNGHRTWFWLNRWIDDCSVQQLKSRLIKAVSKRTRKSRLVYDALHNDQWIRDITGSHSIVALFEYVALWTRLQPIALNNDVTGKFIWKWNASQQYSPPLHIVHSSLGSAPSSAQGS
jgi:hypothetical protein